MLRTVLLLLAVAGLRGETVLDSSATLSKWITHCGSTWGCYRRKCAETNSSNCAFIAMYRSNITSQTFEFVLSSNRHDYAALGFSSDQKMGDDEVLACVKTDSGVEVQHYFNPRKRDASEMSSSSYLDPVTVFSDEGQIGCHFTRPMQVVDDNHYLDLKEAWYHLYAYGPVKGHNIRYHEPEHHAPTSKRKMSLMTDLHDASDAGRLRASIVAMLVAVMVSILTWS